MSKQDVSPNKPLLLSVILSVIATSILLYIKVQTNTQTELSTSDKTTSINSNNDDCNECELNISAIGMYDIIVTDPLGKKTGTFITNHQDIEEIPRSVFYYDDPVGNHTNSEVTLDQDSRVNYITIQRPISGTYSIDIHLVGKTYSYIFVDAYNSDGEEESKYCEYDIDGKQNGICRFYFDPKLTSNFLRIE